MSVTNITAVQHKPNQRVIDALKQALEAAERGDLQDVLITGVLTGYSVYVNHTQYDTPLMLGTLEIVKQSLLNEVMASKSPID